MLTSSVNVVQSSFPEGDQGEISGLSRSVSNLGSSLGVAIAGTIIVAQLAGNREYGLAVIVLGVFACIGLARRLAASVERRRDGLTRTSVPTSVGRGRPRGLALMPARGPWYRSTRRRAADGWLTIGPR